MRGEVKAAHDQAHVGAMCTYDAFALMIGRLVREKVPPNPESTESFEETLNTYLELILLPTTFNASLQEDAHRAQEGQNRLSRLKPTRTTVE